jgi:hypothetical protein
MQLRCIVAKKNCYILLATTVGLCGLRYRRGVISQHRIVHRNARHRIQAHAMPYQQKQTHAAPRHNASAIMSTFKREWSSSREFISTAPIAPVLVSIPLLESAQHFYSYYSYHNFPAIIVDHCTYNAYKWSHLSTVVVCTTVELLSCGQLGNLQVSRMKQFGGTFILRKHTFLDTARPIRGIPVYVKTTVHSLLQRQYQRHPHRRYQW